MALVIYRGTQYDDSRLPAHVNPKECVPIDEWRRAARQGAVTHQPVKTRPQATSKRATKRKRD